MAPADCNALPSRPLLVTRINLWWYPLALVAIVALCLAGAHSYLIPGHLPGPSCLFASDLLADRASLHGRHRQARAPRKDAPGATAMTLKTRLIPCLDVKDGRVVKGVQFVDLRRRRRSGGGRHRL